jgi:hypothetical protein
MNLGASQEAKRRNGVARFQREPDRKVRECKADTLRNSCFR